MNLRIDKAAPPTGSRAPRVDGAEWIFDGLRWEPNNGRPLGAVAVPVVSWQGAVYRSDAQGNALARVEPEDLRGTVVQWFDDLPADATQASARLPAPVAGRRLLLLLLHTQAAAGGDRGFGRLQGFDALARPQRRAASDDRDAEARRAVATCLNERRADLANGVYPPF